MFDPKAKTGIDCHSDYSLRARTFQSGLGLGLRLRLIDASVPKLHGPFGEPAPALGSFFRGAARSMIFSIVFAASS
jgi:hypothetical protein